MTTEIETGWFSYEIAASNGGSFATIEDLRADCEIYSDDGSLYAVRGIFTEDTDRATKKTVRRYLPQAHPLWSAIEDYVIENFNDLYEHNDTQDDEAQFQWDAARGSIRTI